MRYLLMVAVIALALLGTGKEASARGLGPRHYGGPVSTLGYRRAMNGYGFENPYSLRFTHPYPHYYGRWDLYFNMHGAAPTLY
jgi:hypothetical protein